MESSKSVRCDPRRSLQPLPGSVNFRGVIVRCMKILVLAAVVTMITATVPLEVAFGQTKPAQKAHEVPPDLLATLQKDLRADKGYQKCLETEPDSPPLEEQVVVDRLDLNRPQQPALLLRGGMPCLGGNDNGELFLYIRAGIDWRTILHSWGQGVMVCPDAVLPCPVPSRFSRRLIDTHGWPDLAVWQHGSATEGDQREYRFNGEVYKEVACNHVNYQSLGGKTYSRPRSTPCDIPSDFLAMLQNDLEHKTYLQHLRACFRARGKTHAV